MTLMQVWGCLLIVTVFPIAGAISSLPAGGKPNRKTLLCDIALGGIVVLTCRYFFPAQSFWELISLLAFTMGRYWRDHSIALFAVWGGLFCHDWQITTIASFFGLISLTLFRQKYLGTWSLLTLIFVALVIRHGEQPDYWMGVLGLGSLLAWLGQKQADDSRPWLIFRPESAFLELGQQLSPDQVGEDAATLSYLKALGYPVLPGWVIKPGDDLQRLMSILKPKGDRPYMVSLSSVATQALFYIPFEHLTSEIALETAIINCFSHQTEQSQSLLVQAQPSVFWSGITYSRAPLSASEQEPLSEVVRDFITPLIIGDGQFCRYYGLEDPQPWGLQNDPSLTPPFNLLQEVAQLSRQLEVQLGAPQAIQWCLANDAVWILRVKPLEYLYPAWSRAGLGAYLPKPLKPLSASLLEAIAPGVLKSFAQKLGVDDGHFAGEPLVCHYRGYSYFNKSLWEQFCRKLLVSIDIFKKPGAQIRFLLRHPVLSYRYFSWERQWYRNFEQDRERLCIPLINTIKLISQDDLSTLSLVDLVQNIELLTEMLERLLRYWFQGEVSLWRLRLLMELRYFSPPMPLKLQSLNQLALDIRGVLRCGGHLEEERFTRPELFAQLAEVSDGEGLFQRLQDWIDIYGDDADCPWELAEYRWREDSGTIKQQLTDLVNQPRSLLPSSSSNYIQRQLQALHRQQETVNNLCEQFLAQLRWHFLAIASIWQEQGYLAAPSDIFWLNITEVITLIHEPQSLSLSALQEKIQSRHAQFATDYDQGAGAPDVIYGHLLQKESLSRHGLLDTLLGQPASRGSVIGRVRHYSPTEDLSTWQHEDILLAPYIPEHYLNYLPQACGIITTKGGIFSQGASLARDHNVPMVINVTDAVERLQPGQWVHLDGSRGQVELLDPPVLSAESD